MRQRARPGAVSAIGSLVVHATGMAIAFGVATSGPDPSEFVSYNIELVSMPGPDLGELVVEAPPSPPSEAPAPTPQPVVKEPEPTPAPRTEPPKAPPAAAPPKQTQGQSNPSSGDASGSDSGEAMNIRIEGLRRDYPLYYNNIILQIKRCFRWAGQGSPETEVYFVIDADGGVSDARFVRRSGNPSFDYEALGAIECAGQAARLGPLPEDLPFDRLPIRFTFRPGGVTGTFR